MSLPYTLIGRPGLDGLLEDWKPRLLHQTQRKQGFLKANGTEIQIKKSHGT